MPPEPQLTLVAYSTNTWISPLAHLRLLGPAHHAGLQLLRAGQGGQDDLDKVTQADLVVFQRDFPRHAGLFDQVVGSARRQGKPLIFELDDLLLELPEDHPDRLNYFYEPALLPMLSAIIQADLVTVSSQPLADYIRPFNPRLSVLPNYLDDALWTMKPPRQPGQGTGKIVIGYMGGPSHAQDLAQIAPVLKQLARRYGSRVALHFLGVQPPVSLLDEPNVHWEPSRTFEYARFAQLLPSQEYDIVYAPLRDNLFNRCKSAVKYLEYTAIGCPGVYSRLDPYTAAIREGENGLLATEAAEWEAHLSRLVESPELRYQVALQAQADVRTRWMLSDHAHAWTQAYRQALGRSSPESAPLTPEIDVLLRLVERLQRYQVHAAAENESLKMLVEQSAERARVLEIKIESLQAEHQQALQDRDSFSRRLWAIEHSRPWQVVTRLRQIRHALRSRPPAELPSQPPGHAVGMQSKPPEHAASTGKESSSPPKPDGLLHESGLELSDDFPEAISLGLPPPGRYDVLVLPVMDWETRRQRPQQLARQFASAGHRLFYLRTDFHSGDLPRLQQLAENIFEIHLSASMPVNIYKETLEPRLLDEIWPAFEALQRLFGLALAVCLVDLPFWTPMALKLRSEFGWLVVYDCMDEHSGFSSNTPQMLELETGLAQNSDLVLVSSHHLLASHAPLNPNTVMLPNGADFYHFRMPVGGVPPELAGLQAPMIGYYGAIADWFDTDLIAFLARSRPGWQFVLVGSTLYADLTPLRDLHNVHLLGEKPYQSLPPYLHAFDVAIIPFKKSPLTDATNPVKLFEYLSAGKPVVASDLDELHHYSQLISLASTREEWLVALEGELHDQSPQNSLQRIEFARQNTWAHRFQEMRTAIASAFPKVSVVILTYNNLDYTHLCLQSVFENTQYPHYEVIVVDNASTDGTPDYLQALANRHDNLRLQLNQDNLGFAAGNNQGARLAGGEFLVFLNNDTVVPPGWMAGLVRHLRDRQIGMVGPVTNSSGNETRIQVGYTSVEGMPAFAAHRLSSHFGKRFEIRMLAFLCVGMRKEVYSLVGPLDEDFGLGMFEDDDYALRVRAKGFRIVCAEDVFVHHWGSASFSKLSAAEYQRLFEENRRKFEAKWGASWEQHRYRELTPP